MGSLPEPASKGVTWGPGFPHPGRGGPGPIWYDRPMRTMTNAMLVLLVLALPSVARSHPCEAEIARMKQDLESIRKAVATIEAVPPGDTRDQMLTGAKARYDLEQRRIKERQATCDALVAAESPGAKPAPAAVAPPAAPSEAVPGPAPAPVAAPAPVRAPVAAPVAAPAVVVAPAVETVRPVVPPPAAPCFTGCGKDTDCKGDRICVKGECVDPPAKKN